MLDIVQEYEIAMGHNLLKLVNLLGLMASFALRKPFIHNWPLQPFSQDYDTASHNAYIVCVNFLHEYQDIEFQVGSEQQIFEKLFLFFNTPSFCQKSAEGKLPKKYFRIFVLMFDQGFELAIYG